jgi:hypothetical protein
MLHSSFISLFPSSNEIVGNLRFPHAPSLTCNLPRLETIIYELVVGELRSPKYLVYDQISYTATMGERSEPHYFSFLYSSYWARFARPSLRIYYRGNLRFPLTPSLIMGERSEPHHYSFLYSYEKYLLFFTLAFFIL